MHLKSCCALFLLALVACEAAPSAKIENSINGAETTLTGTNIPLEDAGSEKDRAKKSATTFCVEVRSGKEQQVPCTQEVNPPRIVQHESKPVVIVQPIPVPAPVPSLEYHRVIPQPQPQSSQNFNLMQQQQSQVVPLAPAPAPQPLPVPIPQPVTPPAPQPSPPTPVHQHPPIINIIPQAPTAVPCEKPTIVQPQPQFHTVHVIHPQPQSTPKPSFTVIRQEVTPHKEQKLVPQILPVPHQEVEYFEQKAPINACKKCGQRPAYQPFNFFVQPSSLLDLSRQYEESNKCKAQEEGYECSCRPENRIPTLTPYVTSRFHQQKPLSRVMTYPSDAIIRSMPYRSSMISAEANPSTLDQSGFIASDGARDAEGRHHKKQYSPLNLSVQFPVVYPGSDNPKYYEVYRPAYTNPNPYPNPYPNTYPSTYTYGNYENYGTYGTSYPASYDTSASSVPSITVNAGGPFYREAQHIDPSSQSNEIETLPREELPTAKIVDASNNQKRETNIIQLKNEQAEITQEGKEGHSIN